MFNERAHFQSGGGLFLWSEKLSKSGAITDLEFPLFLLIHTIRGLGFYAATIRSIRDVASRSEVSVEIQNGIGDRRSVPGQRRAEVK